MNKNRKGFTIVELVIVIAIIAILAAVLIPTFASLIQKANISKDTQVIRNLNTAIATATEKPETMRDALKIAAEAGYLVDKINAAANGNDILWDSENKVFCYYNAATKAVAYIPETKIETANAPEYKFWKIYNDKMPALSEQRYSIYLTANATAAEEETVKVGFDAGDNTKVKTVNYKNDGAEQKVDIYTTGVMTLTVDAEKDTIYHYGEAGNVEIVKCAPASYHVYGKVIGTISVKQGHVSVEAGATVSAVIVPADATGKVDITNKGTVNIVNTEKANDSANVAVNNKGTIEVSVGTATISGNKANNEYTASKKLTADTHEITEGGYYDGNDVTIKSTGSKNDALYALNIKTTDKVIITGVRLEGTRGVQLKCDKNTGDYKFNITLMHSVVSVKARGIQAWFNEGQNCKGTIINVVDCKFELNTISSDKYDTVVDNNRSTGLIINGADEIEVNIKNTTIQGFSYSVQFNDKCSNKNSVLNIEDSDLKGRAGVYLMNTTSSTVNFKNSKIRGINTFVNVSNIDTESFGLFVFEGSHKNIINIENCKMEAYRGPAAEYNQEYIVDFRGNNNVVNVSGNTVMREDVYFTSDSSNVPTSINDIEKMYREQGNNNIVNGTLTKSIFAVHQGDNVTEYDWLQK